MKKLALALGLVVSCASYAASKEIPNKVGGAIVVTDRKGACVNGSLFAYATTADGNILPGCWTVMDGRVLIQYVTGDFRVYDLTDFRNATAH